MPSREDVRQRLPTGLAKRIFRIGQRKPHMNSPHFSLTTIAFLRAVALRGAAFGLLAAAITQPALAADPSNGERLAMRWCAACHVVTSDQREANADAPPFEEFAKRPNFSESGLTTFLLDPHAKMPNMDLTRFEAGDIAAYVSKLR
jgi:mono/diheme cytochrome c family protein